ncbi:MAG: pseudouridylate synthase [Deltaproteobacteria bacterium]|nr:pseudouridylate synthase [Deltaproteobacteria bacterium]
MSDEIVFVHLDDALAVIAKPSGLSVHRGWAAHEPDYAVDRVGRALGQRVHPVHRLDRATSGVLVFARDPETAAALGRQLEERSVDKRYLALVRGRPPEHITIDHALAAEPGLDKKPAITEVTRLATVVPPGLARAYSLVAARPLTGRPHQIRRHLKHITCPIIGDVNHGRGDQNRLWREVYGLHRLALHALRLDLDHPRTGQRLAVSAPVPDDLRDVLVRAGFPPEHLDPSAGLLDDRAPLQ